MVGLKYKWLWLFIGCLMIAFVVYSSLTTSPVTPGFKFSDKVMHVIGYCGLMGWFIQIYRDRNAQRLLAAGFIALGVGLEFLQDLGGVRVFEFNDMVANMLGVLIGWALAKTPLSRVLWRLERLIPAAGK